MSAAAMSRYAGKVVLVTGGASGIGEACCRRLAAEGARVAILDIDLPGAQRLAEQIRAEGRDALPIACDVTDAAAVERAVGTVVAQFGRLDLAVNNAGIAGVLKALVDYPLETWNRVLGVNLTAVFHCLRSEIPVMVRQGGGAIVNMASILGTVAFPGAGAYVVAKHGVIGLTRTAALEYGAANVRVNAVCPSFIQTPLTLGPIPPGETWDGLAALHAMKRCARPDEISGAVAFLGCDDASFVTGSIQVIDGGFTAA